MRILLMLLLIVFIFLINHTWVRQPIKRLQSIKSNYIVRASRDPADSICIGEPPPTISAATDGIYYDVWLCINDPWSSIITTHWLNNLPPGVEATYSETAPEIFFHGRDTDPFNDLARDGYLHDSGGFQSLWTVGTTDFRDDCRNNCEIQLTRGPFIHDYLVVFKLRNVSGIRESITFQKIGHNVPEHLKKEKRIIARVWEPGGHPDAYVFTKEGQKPENNPLDIIRVYRYHLDIPDEFWSQQGFPNAKDFQPL